MIRLLMLPVGEIMALLSMVFAGFIEDLPEAAKIIVIVCLLIIITWVIFKVGKWILKLVGILIALAIAYILLRFVFKVI